MTIPCLCLHLSSPEGPSVRPSLLSEPQERSFNMITDMLT